MNQIKPYLFWYITGVIVLVEIGFLVFWGQYDDHGNTPQQVKVSLDTEFKNLENLYNRAKAGDPPGRFDPEKPIDIKNLTDTYLITERWKSVLQPIVQKYNQQLEQIRGDLVTRSADLHKPVTENEDLSFWYSAYEGKTKELLLALKNAGALAIAPDQPPPDLETDDKVRSMAGLFTKVSANPQVNEHPLLTTRFRIVEKLSEAIIASKGKNLANPVMEKKVPAAPEQSGAAVLALAWKARDLNRDDTGGVTAYTLTLTLEGSAAALIAAESAIERITSPVVVALGASLGEHGGWRPGERKSKEFEPMTMVMTLQVLDYTNAVRQAPPAPVAAPPTPPRPPPVKPPTTPAKPPAAGEDQ